MPNEKFEAKIFCSREIHGKRASAKRRKELDVFIEPGDLLGVLFEAYQTRARAIVPCSSSEAHFGIIIFPKAKKKKSFFFLLCSSQTLRVKRGLSLDLCVRFLRDVDHYPAGQDHRRNGESSKASRSRLHVSLLLTWHLIGVFCLFNEMRNRELNLIN